MRLLKIRSLPILVIPLVCLVMVEAGSYTFRNYMDTFSPKRSSSVHDKKGKKSRIEQPIKHNYKLILRRNIFKDSELPGSQQATQLKSTPEKVSNNKMVLLGTVNEVQGEDAAVFFDEKTKKQHIYTVGDAVGNMFIKNILRGKVIVSVDGTEKFLDMTEAAKIRNQRIKNSQNGVNTSSRDVPGAVAPPTDRSDARKKISVAFSNTDTKKVPAASSQSSLTKLGQEVRVSKTPK